MSGSHSDNFSSNPVDVESICPGFVLTSGKTVFIPVHCTRAKGSGKKTVTFSSAGSTNPRLVCQGVIDFISTRNGVRYRMKKKRLPNKTFTPIGQVLESILDQCRADSSGGILHLAHVWKQVVGPPICDNAKPFAVKGSLLLVHVSSSTWLHQLRFLKADLLEKLNHGLKNERIEDIKFKIGPI